MKSKTYYYLFMNIRCNNGCKHNLIVQGPFKNEELAKKKYEKKYFELITMFVPGSFEIEHRIEAIKDE